MVSVMYRGLSQRLQALLRSKLSDPASRGTDTNNPFTGDGTATVFTLTNKLMKNIISITVDGTTKYEFTDFTKTYDNPKSATSFPKVTFIQAPASDSAIVVNYHYGQSWVYPGFPQEKFASPRISYIHISSRQEELGVGERVDASTKGIGLVTWLQMDIWVKKGKIVTIDGEYYSGTKLVDKIADDIADTLAQNRELLKRWGIYNVVLRMGRDIAFSKELELFRKLLDYEFWHDMEWSG